MTNKQVLGSLVLKVGVQKAIAKRYLFIIVFKALETGHSVQGTWISDVDELTIKITKDPKKKILKVLA